MSKSISRFIQISDAVLLEYCMKPYDGVSLSFDDTESIEVNFADYIVKLQSNELLFVNDSYISNLAIPMNKENTEFFNSVNKNDISFDEYLYAYNVASGIDLSKDSKHCDFSETIPYDKIKLHISSGYSFEKSNGFYLKVYAKSKDEHEQKNSILLSYSYNKNYSKFIYNVNPIYFSNRVFDKYIEIKLPSIQYLSLNTSSSLSNVINIKNSLNNINIGFNDLYSDNYVEYDLSSLNSSLFSNAPKVNFECGEFNIDKRAATSIPLQAVTDNFGINISESTSGDYIEYYTTWCGKPLNAETVSKFNTIIPLYNLSNNYYQELYETSELAPNEMWYVEHLLKVYLNCNDNNSYLLDNVTNTQFFNSSNGLKFYYKPIPERIREMGIYTTDINSINIIYEAKLINAVDGTGTQIMRTGSLSVNPTKYIINSSNTLNASDIFNYTIYNKIYKTNQNVENNSEISKVKYTKVFYNNTNVNLSGNTGNYVLSLGNSPRNYKFTFTNTDEDGDVNYLNFSNSYYKLYSRDIDNKDIYIDATYSENMNPILGELEFYIPISMIKKLKEVPISNRFMSIVAVNQDNTISTVYEFTYE